MWNRAERWASEICRCSTKHSIRAKPVASDIYRLPYMLISYILTHSSSFFSPSRLLWTHIHKRALLLRRQLPNICPLQGGLTDTHLLVSSLHLICTLILHFITPSPPLTTDFKQPQFSSFFPLLSDWAMRFRQLHLVILKSQTSRTSVIFLCSSNFPRE